MACVSLDYVLTLIILDEDGDLKCIVADCERQDEIFVNLEVWIIQYHHIKALPIARTIVKSQCDRNSLIVQTNCAKIWWESRLVLQEKML